MWKFLILVVGVLFPWWSDAQESKEPWFITDVAVGDAGQVILSCRGDKSLKITDPQGRQVGEDYSFTTDTDGSDR